MARDGENALEQLQHTLPDLILLDVKMPGIDGFETCRRLKASERTHDIPVIFMTALTDTVDKVQGFQAGAVDYVTKPIDHEEVLARVTTHLTLRRLQARLEQQNDELEYRVEQRTAELAKALEEVEQLKNRLQAENVYLREEIKLQHNFDDIIGQSPALKKVLSRVEQVAATDATVMILGETGTGKELIARAVHTLSPRQSRPLIKINCAALPVNLIESELFGHEKGAFTGVLARKSGRFELADGGTIFLDEVGDLPLELQAKLLRALQEGEFERLGGTQTLRVDVRVIAATNRNLEQAIRDGSFREDLYYRLNVFPVTPPPLRERPEDIPLLVQFFTKKFGTKLGKSIDTIPETVMAALQAYAWPGNVRELENIIERAVILSPDHALVLDEPLTATRRSDRPAWPTDKLEDIEREHILHILNDTDWRIAGMRGAADRLGLNPSTLRSRMQKLGIRKRSNTS
ncbi:MAG: transcriptional regulator [Candidatus Entotheonella factor]|uniref:Transcriptional regulator n=1 Tax=Entotheonella factor TaxID=1429438 RepID=W4L8U8_ENTF1|nr:MAG: transcriptional regulator [Candidatus Entotheonella factor]